MENGLLGSMYALSTMPRNLQPFVPADLLVSRNGDLTIGTGAGAGWNAAYELIGPFCYYEFDVQFGTAPTIGASGFNLVSLRLPVPALPAPAAQLVGGTNPVSDLLAGSNVCAGNAHFTTQGEAKSAEMFPALFQGANGVHPDRQNAIFLPCVKRFEITGTATVSSGTKVVSVTHGHGRAPALQDIKVQPQASWQAAGCTQFWPDTVAATTFALNATGAAAANLTGNLVFNWSATIASAFFGSQLFPFDANAGGQFKGAMLYRWR